MVNDVEKRYYYGYEFSKFCDKDYVYSNYNEDGSYEIESYPEDKEVILRGIELYDKHFEYYQEIATKALSQVGIVPEFVVVEYSK